MTRTSWREHLLTSFGTIDNQHREIAHRTDELLVALRADSSRSELERLVTALVDATVQHFGTEEGLMLASGYPGFEEHRNEHRRLVEQLQLVKAALAAGNLTAYDRTVEFIRTLTDQHVFFSDKPLARHLIDQGFVS